jgi:hypothetical protein
MPRPISTPSRATFDADIRTKLADARVDAGEANDLVRGWSTKPLTQAQADALKSSIQGANSTFDRAAGRVMDTFVRVTLPTLVVRQPIGQPTNTAKLSWTPPTRNTDGSALTDLKGYKAYFGQAPGQYTKSVDVNDPAATSLQIDNLASGTWYFAMKAVDTAGNESAFSNEASKTIP